MSAARLRLNGQARRGSSSSPRAGWSGVVWSGVVPSLRCPPDLCSRPSCCIPGQEGAGDRLPLPDSFLLAPCKTVLSVEKRLTLHIEFGFRLNATSAAGRLKPYTIRITTPLYQTVTRGDTLELTVGGATKEGD